MFPANQTSLPESDLEHFKKQASCLGFSSALDYQHDPEKGASPQHRPVPMTTAARRPHACFLFAAFCLEEEGVHVMF